VVIQDHSIPQAGHEEAAGRDLLDEDARSHEIVMKAPSAITGQDLEARIRQLKSAIGRGMLERKPA
jgi:hypothetical protein